MASFDPLNSNKFGMTPKPEVKIRAMEASDLDAVIEMGTSTAEFDTSTDSPQFYSRETLERWIASPNGVLLVAESGSEVIGFRLAAFNPDSRDGYLHTIAVKQSYRDQGIGTQLMTETLRRLESLGCNHVVGLVQEGNDSTLGFLRKNGFDIGAKFHYCDVSLPLEKRHNDVGHSDSPGDCAFDSLELENLTSQEKISMKLKLSDGTPFEVGGIKGRAVTAGTGITSGGVSSLKVEGRHGRIKTTLSDRFYYVVSGAGTFDVGGEKFDISSGDLVVVPRDTPYDFEGRMELLLFCSPAFDPSHEVVLENVVK